MRVLRRTSSRALCALFLLLPLTETVYGNGQAAGVVRTVNVTVAWGGFMVQLDNPITANFETTCPFSNWAFMGANEPLYKSMLATLIAAKASGERITVYTDG